MGLDVAQIVITAATPMTEDPAPFPVEDGEGEGEGEPDEPEEEVVPDVPDLTKVEESQSSSGPPKDQVEQEPSPIPQSAISSESQEPQSKNEPVDDAPGWAAFADDLVSSLPRVVDVEVKESATFLKMEPKKSSLEIEDKSKSKISLGESNESPVTPEELDMHNLAKLESLKESDA